MQVFSIGKFGNVVLANVRAGVQEFLVLMLANKLDEFRSGLGTVEDFPLADDDVLLQVIGGLLRDTEILHVGRHFDTTFLTDSEKVINGIAAREDNRSQL